MLDIRAYVILLLDFPLCLVIVAKNEIKSLLRSGGTCYCYAWTGKLLLRSGGKCCCYAWNDKLKPGRITQCPCILSCIVRPLTDGNVWEQKRQQETVAQLGNCDAEFGLRNRQSALSLNGTEIWLPSYKQQFLCRMDIRKETDPEEEGAESLAGPVREAENCGACLYMKIVGSLIWISGVRGDILFAVMYLTWFTKQPCTHHQLMVLYVLSYLYNTKHIPLILGGNHPIIRLHTYTDSSSGTGPKGRSIAEQLSKLNPNAGSIHAKSQASTLVRLSSFESELEAATGAIKS